MDFVLPLGFIIVLRMRTFPRIALCKQMPYLACSKDKRTRLSTGWYTVIMVEFFLKGKENKRIT